MCAITFDWRENDASKKFEEFEKTRKEWYGSLLWATVEFTELCNHKCIYCYANAGPKRDYKSIDKERMEDLVNYFGEQKIKQLTCSGGEPLLYPHIKETVQLAKENGLIVHMITNGYFLTKRRARELYDAGLSQVQINIDSIDPKKHDRMRGKQGSFIHAVQALKNAKDVGLTCVSQTVLTKQNENEIIDIFKFARSIGIQRCRVWDITPPSTGRALEHMHLKPTNNYIETTKKIVDWACENGVVNIESGDPLFHKGVESRVPISGGYCPYSIGILTNLSVQGDAYFCCANRDRPMYNVFEIMKGGGNLRRAHVKALGSLLKEMQMFKLPSECKGCNFIKTCKGGCYMRRKYANYGIDYWCPHLSGAKESTLQKSRYPLSSEIILPA